MISRTSDIEDIVNDYPELIRPLKDYGIACIACGEPVWGTLEDLAKSKNIDDIDKIIAEMNMIIKKGKQ
ncbi:MAG: DUF1858 domain-containing protein [Candidatus Marinimicrobia bacterium]|nr:DUF1858 domain-containing protein [Candidatus Neomarinimicrobiota bacterium]